jgi:predicted N-acyltransferase|tara:strand:+ start:8700 stop:9890 length:1191 start_codon:yes stop_codon:yes gene_type:complete
MQELELSFVDSIAKIGEETWRGLVGKENPFTRYEFLHALEYTACTTEETGWQPHHVIVRTSGDGANVLADHSGTETINTVEAIVPLFLKNNSWGEYVFDWSWANAYKSHGFEYYPKFVTAAPFTPSVGQRIFVRDKNRQEELFKLITDKIKEKAEFIGASSWHILFPQEDEHLLLNKLGIAARVGSQFHWQNRGYENFDDFLSAMNSRKRKSIRKERKSVAGQEVSFRCTEGVEISEQQWADFYLFYQSTYAMRGMQGYLKQTFFRAVAESMPEQLMLINAMQNKRDIAAALFFKNSETLFGRYWGSAQDYHFLHFETCYYQGQEYAIREKLKSFDSGAQGEHKIQRGFEPILTYSNHWLSHQGFRDAIANFLDEEKPHILQYKDSARELLPFKKE